jgi:hypothetical protein
MGGNPEVRTDHWGSNLTAVDYDTDVKLIWILAAWCKRQQKTSVEFHELIELLGLQGSLTQLLEQRSTKRR